MLLKSTKFNYVFTKEHFENLPDGFLHMPTDLDMEFENAELIEYLLTVDGIEEVKEDNKE